MRRIWRGHVEVSRLDCVALAGDTVALFSTRACRALSRGRGEHRVLFACLHATAAATAAPAGVVDNYFRSSATKVWGTCHPPPSQHPAETVSRGCLAGERNPELLGTHRKGILAIAPTCGEKLRADLSLRFFGELTKTTLIRSCSIGKAYSIGAEINIFF